VEESKWGYVEVVVATDTEITGDIKPRKNLKIGFNTVCRYYGRNHRRY